MPATYGGSSGSAGPPPTRQVINLDGNMAAANRDQNRLRAEEEDLHPPMVENTSRNLRSIGLPWIRIDFPFVTSHRACKAMMAAGSVSLAALIPTGIGNVLQSVVAASWICWSYSPRITALTFGDQICGCYTITVLGWIHLPPAYNNLPDWVLTEYIMFFAGWCLVVGFCGLFVDHFEFLFERARMPDVYEAINLLPQDLEENLQEVERFAQEAPVEIHNEVVPAGVAVG